ncbi:MAG: DUF423 domain-containing protein [Bacteroidia bacterium]|nr:DUF423 domain-containing protein [Bacteroidia bacterium]
MKFLTPQFFAFLASVLGGVGVILGALGAHALKNIFSAEKLNSFETATRYQLIHAIVLLFLSWNADKVYYPLFQWIALLFTLGIIFFSGSIYILVLHKIKALVWVTPLGGILLIVAWFLLAYAIFTSYTK